MIELIAWTVVGALGVGLSSFLARQILERRRRRSDIERLTDLLESEGFRYRSHEEGVAVLYFVGRHDYRAAIDVLSREASPRV